MKPVALLFLLAPAQALAGQVVSPTVFEGPYALSCASANLSLNVGLSAATAAGNASWGDVFEFPLLCQVPVADLQAAVDEIEAGCTAAGLPAASCLEVADDLYLTLLPFTDLGADVMPDRMTVDIDTANWWGRWTGVYYANIKYGWADGRTSWVGHLFDNNAGYVEGHFASAGFAIQGSGAQQGLGCAVTSVAAIDGYVRRTLGYTVTGSFGVNQSLTCLAAGEGVAVLANVGISFSGQMTGHKVP